ncbi:MAG: hypothetical protein GXP21_00345 [Gammaproteobacteria bacterium]|nr:hypothetical protein [Gammaproteobacteria bacterium]
MLEKALILHGDEDHVVTPRNPKNISPRLMRSGVETEYKLYPGIGHIRLISGLANLPGLHFDVQDDILQFLEK